MTDLDLYWIYCSLVSIECQDELKVFVKKKFKSTLNKNDFYNKIMNIHPKTTRQTIHFYKTIHDDFSQYSQTTEQVPYP
jgi:hypothetical protein